MRKLILLLIASPLAGQLVAQSPDLPTELLAARDTVWRAWFANDTSLLRRYLPPATAVLDGRDAHWSDRKAIMDDSRGFARSKGRLVELNFAATEISSAGHTALIRSSYTTVVESNGRRDTTRGRAIELFVRQGKTWVNPYWQLQPGTTGEREIPQPDTLGANFSVADSATRTGTPADYDLLVGTWEFRFQPRDGEGNFYPPFTGHWTFDKKPGGGLVEDRWRPDNPATPMAQSLYTYRTFDPKRKLWQMIGSSSNGGTNQPGLTWSDGAYRYAIQWSNGALTRIRYQFLDENHFIWRSDSSLDGGRTWLLDNGMMEAKRIGK
jgi:hypothetical protein